MACVCGTGRTMTISDDGEVYSFGQNNVGQLGLGHNKDVSMPTPILNLPKIKQVSCSAFFTVCVDYEGIIWAFGQNIFGIQQETIFNVPQKIQDIPPVHSVVCGYEHTLIITTDSNLCSCGKNNYGELCTGNNQNIYSNIQQTPFSNILRVSACTFHSLFQNIKGEIFSCGFNNNRECGLVTLIILK